MGNCCVKEDNVTLVAKAGNSSAKAKVATKKALEDRIELAFKAKRANVFAANALDQSIGDDEDAPRSAFVEKIIPKSSKQNKVICKTGICLIPN